MSIRGSQHALGFTYRHEWGSRNTASLALPFPLKPNHDLCFPVSDIKLSFLVIMGKWDQLQTEVIPDCDN